MEETRRIEMLITGHKPDMGEVVAGEKRIVPAPLAKLLVEKGEAAYADEEVTHG